MAEAGELLESGCDWTDCPILCILYKAVDSVHAQSEVCTRFLINRCICCFFCGNEACSTNESTKRLQLDGTAVHSVIVYN